MGLYTLSNREKREALYRFHKDHVFLREKVEAKDDISNLSFEEFCSLMDIVLTRDQRILAKLTFSQKVTCCVAGHGVGKSYSAALLVLYTVICKRGLGVTTAPTARQVKNILFAEINRNFAKLKRNPELKNRFGIDLEKDYSIGHTFLRQLEPQTTMQGSDFSMWYENVAMPKVSDISENLETQDFENMSLGVCYGMTSRDSSSFQGIHYAGDFVIVGDEFSGIDEEIVEAMESCVTGVNNRILAIGNPICRGNAHERLAKAEGAFIMSPFSHPNISPWYKKVNGRWILTDDSCLTDSYVPVIDGAVTPQWIEDARSKYGEKSLFWQTRVLARFPRLQDMAGAMFPDSVLGLASEPLDLPARVLTQLAYLPLYVGCDIGESGDPSVYSFGNWLEYNGPDGQLRNMLLVRAIVEIESEGGDHIQQKRNFDRLKELVSSYTSVGAISGRDVYVGTDNTGIGVSLTKDIYVDTDYQCLPCHFKSAAVKRSSFVNLRAELFWSLKTLYENRTINIYPSVLEEQIEQTNYELTGIRYVQNPKDERIQIIPKEEIKAILGCSPDHADSLSLLAYTAMFYEGEIKDEKDRPAREYLNMEKEQYA